MADPEQVAAVIRFALNDLGGRNAQHDFEHLCRHVARGRIAANVLPATGPVSARGDQSRDFESYTTHLPRELPGTSVFATGTSNRLVFACTTQQKGLRKKITGDIAGIVAPGAPDEVHYFCTRPVDVGLRHELQAWAMDEHGVALEIHDVYALGQHLADADLFWVAERYLNIPAELRPEPEDVPGLADWYVESLARWRTRAQMPAGLGDLIDIKDGLRQSTSDEDARPDLPFWLALMREFLPEAHPEWLRQRARYEVAVATLSGQDDLRPAEEAVREFFAEIEAEDSPTLLEDASVLLMYCAGAYARGLTGIDARALSAWNAALRSRVRSLLDENPPVNRRAALLSVLAHLGIHPDVTKVMPRPGDDLPAPSEITAAFVAGDIDVLPEGEPVALVDVDSAFNAWQQLVDLLPEAGMFPVGRLAELYGFMAPMLVDDPRYGSLRDALDQHLAEASGRAAVADVCRQRALSLRQSGRHLAALQEFHQAKVDWWSGDTLRGSLLSMLLISQIYLELRLPVAGRYYALAAASAARATQQEDLADLIPQALAMAARADHLAGAWWAETRLLDLATRAHAAYVEPSFDMETFTYLESVAVHGAMLLTITRLIGHRLTEEIERTFSGSGLLDLLDHMVGNTPAAGERSRAEWLAIADDDLCGRPFSDVGPVKVLRWSALGLDWTVRCRNRRTDVLAAERFAAAAQILAVELLSHDLLLMPTSIAVFVETRPSGDADLGAHDLPSNEGRQWRVVLTAYDGPGSLDDTAVGAEPLAALANILIEASLLPQQAFFDAIEAAFQRGLSHKLHAARPYDDVAGLLLDDQHFANPAAQYGEPLGLSSEHPARPAPQLEPITAPGPTYSRAQAEEMLRNRYKTLPPLIALTLPRLNQDAAFRAVVTELRRRGWLDWHLLTAAANIAMNHRLRVLGALRRPRSEDERRRLGQLALQHETADMPAVPPTLFTLEAMENARCMAMLHLVEHWDLHGHQPTPDFPAITRLLADRYGYWTDDIAHDDPFPP
jgi:hypothetical protein